MVDNENSSIYNPERGTMFDSGVVEALHERHELRVRDVQQKVSAQFDGLKRFSRDLWKVQRFEDLIFGRVVIPFDVVNTYVQELQFPKVIDNVKIGGLATGELLVTINHKKHGCIFLNIAVHEILIEKKSVKLGVCLKSWEMPDASWFVRNMIKIGLMMTGLEIAALNKAIPSVEFKKGTLDNEYEIDLTNVVQVGLKDYELSMDMIRLLDWGINDKSIGLQLSINAEKLVNYLKKRMPILFD